MSAPPTSDQFNDLIRAYALCTLVLFLKYLFSLFYGANMNNHPEEDKGKVPLLPVPEDIKRRERQFHNDIENIPFHFGIYWAAFVIQCFTNACGKGKTETMALTALVIVYTLLRISYTVCYIIALQPFRSIVWALSQFCTLVTACVLVTSAWKFRANEAFPQAYV